MTLSAKLCVNMIGSRRPNLLLWRNVPVTRLVWLDVAVLLPELIEKSLIVLRDCQPWFLMPAPAGVLFHAVPERIPSLQLADLSAILFLATFASCGVFAVYLAKNGDYSHTQLSRHDFVLDGCWPESCQSSYCGRHSDRTTGCLWFSGGCNYLSLAYFRGWLDLLITHKNTLGFSFGFVWLRRSLLLSSQRANQISILPGQSKSFNYIWPIAIGSSQSAYHNRFQLKSLSHQHHPKNPPPSPTEEFITSTSSKASSASSNWRVYHSKIIQSKLSCYQATSPHHHHIKYYQQECHRIQLLKRITPSCSPEWL